MRKVPYFAWFPIILLLAHFNLLGFSFGQTGADATEGLTFREPEPPKNDNCILFSDGRFAVVGIDSYYCGGQGWMTVSWFLFKGYHIDAVTGDVEGDSTSYGKAYMSR